MSRRTAFASLWAVAVLLPLISLAGGAWWSWGLVQAEARSRLERTVMTLREHAQRGFETQDALLAAVQRVTQGMSWPEIAGSAEVASFLRDLDAATPGAGAIGMVDPDGRLVHVSSVAFPFARTEVRERDYVQAQRTADTARPFVGRPIVTRVNELQAFPYSRPRLGADGKPDGGVLWATFRLSELGAYYARVLEHPNDSVALVRADGASLAHYPPSPRGLEVAAPPEGSRLLAAIREAAASPAGSRAVVVQADFTLDSKARLHAMLRVGELPVVVSYALHPDGPRAAWLAQIAAMTAVAGAATLLLLGLTSMFIHRARREMAALETAREAAEARADAEVRLREGERLGALGLITAGVAHDIRNLIQAVQGGVQMIRAAARGGDTARVFLVAGMVEETAARGAALTERMLRAARPPGEDGTGGATLEPRATAERAKALLAGMFGAPWRLRLVVDVDEDAPPARARGSEAELEAALLNLCSNARAAMPEGGEIVIRLSGEEVAEGQTHPAGLPPGTFARFAVSDAGVGMDAATLARAGEAFFTTKPRGVGTGLGLAGVRAFAQETGGAVLAESPGPGLGATLTLWLPAA